MCNFTCIRVFVSRYTFVVSTEAAKQSEAELQCFARAKGTDSERVPRVAGRRRISSSAPEEGRVAGRGELSAQLKGARFSLSPSTGRGGCREGFVTLEAKGCVRGPISSRSCPSFPLSLPLTHIHTRARVSSPFGLPFARYSLFALVRLCALTYVYIDTQPEAGQVNRPSPPDDDQTGVICLSHPAISPCLT